MWDNNGNDMSDRTNCKTCEFEGPCVLCVWVSRDNISYLYGGILSHRERVGKRRGGNKRGQGRKKGSVNVAKIKPSLNNLNSGVAVV